MKFPSRFLYRGLLLLGLGVWSLNSVRADFITPAGVWATSYYNSSSVTALNLINGAVTSPSTVVTGSGFWHAAATTTGAHAYNNSGATTPNVDSQALIFTLPGTYNLSAAYLWQMNQSGQFGRGIDEYDLSVSADGVSFVPVATAAHLNIASGNETAQTQALNATGVRFVRLDINTAHSGTTTTFVGLNEVRFEGTQVAAGPTRTITAAATSAELPAQPSSSDLLQGKVAAVSRALSAGNAGMLTDGLGTNNLSHRVLPADNAANTTDPVSFTYDATALGLAVDQALSINTLNVFGYNTDGRRVNDFDVLYTTDGTTWQYAFIGASNVTLGTGVTLTSLSIDGTQNFLTNVRGLRFDFRPINSTLQSTLIELDALGSIVTIPEPGTLALGGAGVIALLARARRNGRAQSK